MRKLNNWPWPALFPQPIPVNQIIPVSLSPHILTANAKAPRILPHRFPRPTKEFIARRGRRKVKAQRSGLPGGGTIHGIPHCHWGSRSTMGPRGMKNEFAFQIFQERNICLIYTQTFYKLLVFWFNNSRFKPLISFIYKF